MSQPDTLIQISDRDGDSLAPKQARLIRSAYKVMGEKGLGHLSLQDVADDAGVSKAILPYYFESKENLILLTMRWVLARVAQRIREAISRAESAESKVSAMIDAIFVNAESNRRFYLVFFDFLGYAARNDRFADVGATFHEICNGLYAEVVRAGQEEGVFNGTDAREAATVVRALVDGLFTQWIQEKDWENTHAEYREVCKRSVLAYLTAGV
ncbi:TetR family transcriptional regulator [Rubrobacter marinus]|uniref:TetR family transcriptional regulator n=1 Tax=Rubrobacter marinus TaxID=2653852 RepID=A0A6G8PX75_9ACTN|nr:TetR family transcriptional regulator C-terminal domain-containing protein [Rubrobacter marinus]QIN78768.1 TetR family transcriptional regulator [Rubrobacter marinus]